MAGSEDLPLSSSTGGFEGAQEHLSHEVVVIGGGLAGLRAALAAAEAGVDVSIVTKVHPLRSHSVAAQGGINAALREDDSVESHAFDTVKGSDYLADQEAVMVLAGEAPNRVREMEHWGTVFSRAEDGRIAQRPFGGAGYPRTAFAQDRTGHNLLHTLYETALREGIRVYEEFFVTKLVVSGGQCSGLIALDIKEGQLHSIQARSVIIATGGYGRVFARSTNAVINNGDGAALAYRVGVPLEDMEFIQFHPTTLYGTNILISEGVRGEGGHLRNSEGERFMARYAAKAMELAPRDIVARSIQTEINEGRGIDGQPCVHLDITHLGADRVKERLPGIREICIHFAGLDPIDTPIPVQPGQHYSMGGVACDSDGATEVAGLYAAGEAACVSVHGANRLGCNSLIDLVVFGNRAGRAVGEYARGMDWPMLPQDTEMEAKRRLLDVLDSHGTERVPAIREEMQALMTEKCSIYRDRAGLEDALDKLESLKERYDRLGIVNRGGVHNYELREALEMGNMLQVSETILRSALAREESRGAHYRTDHPERDDVGWLKHTLIVKAPEGLTLNYKPVTITRFQPQERRY
ncbi:MAG: FAD-dependent oxidoreductase [Thermoplasmata archaeon]|nr:FAD-dependent oxidoreductase [Thermoplasmata archaeon]